MRILLLLFMFLFGGLFADASTLNFNSKGDEESNQILKEFISSKVQDENFDVTSYFEDIDNDGSKEIVGIAKSGYFYSLKGYKLIVLKNVNSSWESFKSDVYFDIAKNVQIEDKKITYYKTIFYKNKKCRAKIKQDRIVTSQELFDCCKNKKAKNIEEITKFSEGTPQNKFELENFHAQECRDVNIHYVNLSEKTKHYLDLK